MVLFKLIEFSNPICFFSFSNKFGQEFEFEGGSYRSKLSGPCNNIILLYIIPSFSASIKIYWNDSELLLVIPSICSNDVFKVV